MTKVIVYLFFFFEELKTKCAKKFKHKLLIFKFIKMKKLFLVAALGIAGLMSASNNIKVSESTNNQQSTYQGDWGCYGELWIYDDYAESWVLINHYSICCYDTPEQACAVEEQLLVITHN